MIKALFPPASHSALFPISLKSWYELLDRALMELRVTNWRTNSNVVFLDQFFPLISKMWGKKANSVQGTRNWPISDILNRNSPFSENLPYFGQITVNVSQNYVHYVKMSNESKYDSLISHIQVILSQYEIFGEQKCDFSISRQKILASRTFISNANDSKYMVFFAKTAKINAEYI